MFDQTDTRMMQAALALAREGRFTTSPNPRVGCVIAQGGQIVGQGFHVRAGEPHAEAHALRQAGWLARGATAYITLEPCSHYGRTPPCAAALIGAGVSRVVAALSDPNPQVAGRGLEMLREAGIETQSGLLEAEARELNRGFLSRMERGRPFVRLKCAASLDGRTALSDGRSKWITGEAARADVHTLRAESCAVLTGINTVLADDPLLNVRAFPVLRQPARVILDTGLRIPDAARLLHDGASTVAIATLSQDQGRKNALAALPHVHIIQPGQKDGRIDLADLMHRLAQHSYGEVLAEAGARLSGALLAAGLVDEIVLYQSAKILGSAARPLFSLPENPAALESADWQTTEVQTLDGDIKWILRRRNAAKAGL
ncbi:MAG: bifunctional diaminohydroxyphosphoribosylaminopyrimidine deaminase/5-amino-6-(5-phosphoribosylamino)uracil reductase RibD [Neisseria sp.]|nr:bifunctional diaminohydroxyphosphoribosylaminopyrimidine deaminase/5-amino-6-(5-phosphoribosylamino)uracil reductase RibD [Neisseria sp.]